MKGEEAMLSKEQIEGFRSVLLEKQRILYSKISNPVEKKITEVNGYEKEDRERELEISVANDKIFYQQLQRINQALERLENGVYGICSKCHNWIEKVRLDVQPEAEQCLTCSRLQGSVLSNRR
jgi:DnaK suppressor protein